MDFTLSKQQQMVQKMYREFAENEVKPLAKKVDAEEYFPKETVEKMGKLGMMGIYFPTSVGGAGGDVLSYVMAVEELSKVCGTTGVIVSAHTSLCAAPIYENGTPEQKAKYLPKLCSGEWLGAFGLTEPVGQGLRAVLDGKIGLAADSNAGRGPCKCRFLTLVFERYSDRINQLRLPVAGIHRQFRHAEAADFCAGDARQMQRFFKGLLLPGGEG